MNKFSRIVCVGAGPAGLSFSILMKQAFPKISVEIYERSLLEDISGFGVILSERLLSSLQETSIDIYSAIERNLIFLPEINIDVKGTKWRLLNQNLMSISRSKLLDFLIDKALQIGVKINFGQTIFSVEAFSDADLILGCDGVNSHVRNQYANEFRPMIMTGTNRFIWLSADIPFENFTFSFVFNRYGLWIIHAYKYLDNRSTFVVECSENTWIASGLDCLPEVDVLPFLEEIFDEILQGAKLYSKSPNWSKFNHVSCEKWFYNNVALLGDALHASHFSTGSGTSMALEDSLYLVKMLMKNNLVQPALNAFQNTRKLIVEQKQNSILSSAHWFENAEYYWNNEPSEFVFSLLTRSNQSFMKKMNANLIQE